MEGDDGEIPDEWAARDRPLPQRRPIPLRVGQRWVCGEANEILEIRGFFDDLDCDEERVQILIWRFTSETHRTIEQAHAVDE